MAWTLGDVHPRVPACQHAMDHQAYQRLPKKLNIAGVFHARHPQKGNTGGGAVESPFPSTNVQAPHANHLAIEHKVISYLCSDNGQAVGKSETQPFSRQELWNGSRLQQAKGLECSR